MEALLLAVRGCLELRRSHFVAFRRWQETKRKFATDRADVAARADHTAVHSLACVLLNEELAGMVESPLGLDPAHAAAVHRQPVLREAAHRPE